MQKTKITRERIKSVDLRGTIKMAQLFNLTTGQIINYDGKIPTQVVIEDRTAVEHMRLIQQIEEDDKQTIFQLINKMLTDKKFKNLFAKNVATDEP